MSVGEAKNRKVGAVMVAGAGIGGMQAALDLANSGFKVYLVEESSAIGGRMSQLDKTFPTNDCAMCTISPKLVEVDKHPNIEILTRTKILSLEGKPGRFKAKVIKAPRFVDLELCNACGDCLEVCPVAVENDYEQGLAQRKAIFKKYPQAIPNALAIDKNERPPCVQACPARVNCQGYAALTAQGKFAEAAKLIYERNPFLSICGRVCHHPCEAECYRGEHDEPVAINPIKRFLGDWALDHPQEMREVFERQRIEDEPLKERRAKNRSHRIAVIGSGPAGLTSALDLVKLGYQVTIFEASPVYGGMLRTGFPDYRLPKGIVDQEIRRILDEGIELKLNTTVGRDVSLEELSSQGYEASFIAIGLQIGRVPKLEGSDHAGVLNGLEFLRQVNLGEPFEIGQEVIVIGGGNVAIDVAITARRVGAGKVKLVCLESRESMPAHAWEIQDALEEGVEIHNSWGPVRINGQKRVSGVHLRRCTRVIDEAGRFNPQYDESATMELPGDTLIFAIGQAIDRNVTAKLGLELSDQGTVKVDETTLETSIKGVFAGGDAIKVRSSVVEAVAFGHEASISIDRYIHGEDLYRGRQVAKEVAPRPEKPVTPAARVKERRISIQNRQGNFAELALTIGAEEAVKEAKRCLNCGICSECLQCVYVCGPKAIFHDMKPVVEELDIGALIIATGVQPFAARAKPEFGYGRYPNVLTSLEFERVLSASGPFGGHITRPSDHRAPKRIAWLQCVGSRDQLCGKEYCSSVCCMYATKQAIVTREHAGGDIETFIFYNDIRAFGKGFDRYYDRARNELGVRYVKCGVSSIKQLQQSKNLIIKYIDDGNQIMEEEFDMAVLSVGLVPSASSKELFDRLGVQTNRYGFCQAGDLRPSRTNLEGVFVCGAGESPKDIPESVMEASCAAALAGELLADVRGSLISEKEYPLERSVDHEEPKVGLFICHCGTNIARVIDVESLAQFGSRLPHVVHAERNLYTCSTDTQRKMVETIREKGINRVVVSSCTPRTHEPLFQDTIREAGLNKYLFEMANIRDQCSWVHPDTPDLALEKAKDLVAMAVQRAATLEPLVEKEFPISRSALVIGGGAAGMTAALSLANQGFKAFIVEKSGSLGGNLKKVRRLLDGTDTSQFLSDLIRKVDDHPGVEAFMNAEIVEFSGHVGEFHTLVRYGGQERKIDHGVLIFATGAREHQPDEYLYGKSKKVMTQLELEALIAENPEAAVEMNRVVMIQCVGSREEPHNYCSRICCQEAVKNALQLAELNPEAKIYVLYRDMRTYGFQELYYLKAREKGVIFIRFDPERKPEVQETGGRLEVKVFDSTLLESVELEADRLILSAGVRAQENLPELLQKFKVPANEDGFLLEAHMKLRPLDFASEGMFMAGLAHAPKVLKETLIQACGAASRAATILSKERLRISGSVAVVDEDKCAICLTCIRVCPYNVPKINENNRAYIDAASCQGCGTCAAACPAKAIEVQHYKDNQILAKCDALDILRELESV